MTEAEGMAGEAFSPLGPREEDRGSGARPYPLEPPPPSSDTQLEAVVGLGWEANAEGKAWGQQCPHGHGCVCICAHIGALTVPSPQCRCGQRRQPVPASPWGADQERRQEVGEEFLPKKGAFPLSAQTWPFPPLEAPGEPRDSGLLRSDSALLGSQRCIAPSPLSLLPSDDGESAVR